MSTSLAFRVLAADWIRDAAVIRSVRTTVFVDEQGVPAEIEDDGEDPAGAHVLAVNENGEAIGTGRLLVDGHIGRLAVLREMRGRGVGAALLEALIGIARERGMHEVALNAQLHAASFYARYGFRPEGEVFHEGGIPHQPMVHRVSPAGPTLVFTDAVSRASKA